MALKFKNFWVSALTSAAAAADTIFYIPTVDASNLPALGAGDTIRMVLPVLDTSTPPKETDWEIVEVTAVNTITGALTVTRAMEGTVAKDWPTGAVVDPRLTAAALASIGTPTPDFAGQALSDYTDTSADVAVTAATTTLDLAAARVFRLAMGASTKLAFSNVPTTGVVAITLICTQDATGGRTLTLPTGTKYPGGTAPALSTAANAEDWIELVKHPALADWRAFTVGKAVA